ncbi:MAG TPA: hypothetical protein VNA17_09885 [Pyrinomonadaceae bacterium]|nr:hypothetical protein [Pyrinomonadaceae bacterium]
MKVFALACVALSFALHTSGQATAREVIDAQKALKKALYEAPWVRSVKFDDCRVSIKTETRRAFSSAAGGSNSFPPGESSLNLSAGADQFGWDSIHHQYVLDLSLLDTAKVTVHPSLRKGTSVFTFTDEPKGLITAKRPDEMLQKFRPGVYVLAAKTKSVDKTLRALENITKLCGR